MSVLFCLSCGTGLGGIRLEACPTCGTVGRWSLESPVPRVPYRLTRDDARLMRANGIRVEDAEIRQG